MSTITKEFTKEQLIASAHARIEFAEMMLAGELEPLKERTWSIELELARIALASLEAEKKILYRERNPYNGMTTGWQELAEDEYEFIKDNAGENAEFRTVYTAPPAPVADLLLSELLAIAKKAADAADECAHAEWSDDSMEHSTAIADWERRTAMIQGAEQTNYRAIVERIAEIVHGKVTDIDLLTVTVKSMKDKLHK